MHKRHSNTHRHPLSGDPTRVAHGRPSTTRTAALRSLGPVVYAVRAGDVVRIGHTADLATRCNHIGSHDVLAFASGTREDARRLQASLAGHEVDPERPTWFHSTAAVLAAVNRMRDAIGLQPTG